MKLIGTVLLLGGMLVGYLVGNLTNRSLTIQPQESGAFTGVVGGQQVATPDVAPTIECPLYFQPVAARVFRPTTCAIWRPPCLRNENFFVFVHHEGVEPTNNRAERALRCAG